MKRVVAVVQARMGSTRLPGKVLADIAGKPMLQHVVERVSRAQRIDAVVVAASLDPRDKPILDYARQWGALAVAGSEDDVLDRFILAARTAQADVVVRTTADCPMIDPAIVDQTVAFYFDEKADYAANCIQQTFPRGSEVEVFSARLLEVIGEEAQLPFEREHVTPHFYLNPDQFQTMFLAAKGELRRSDLRFCVDTQDDLDLVREIFTRLGPGNAFSLADAIRLVSAHPELQAWNAHIRQKKLGE